MAKLVLRDADIVIDGVNLSDHASSVEINSAKDLVETTSFGASYKTNLVGMGDATISVTFFQDFAAASVDATLWPIHDAEEEVVIVVKPTSAAVSATNPSYTMTGVLPEFAPISGEVGEASTTEVEFQNSSDTGIVRAVA
jgi:predicted subunit of tRNA(5-methylaminomethyl-2-thiouridylate) methyltransferase